MMYKKPENITYTDMCIYIDEHVYLPNHDTETIYKYLYLLSVMLAKQASLFDKHRYYDGFGIFAATRVYLRLTNPKQFMLNAEGYPKMERITSILNYLRKSIYFLKVDYEQEEYSQSLSKECGDILYNYENAIQHTLDGVHKIEFESTLTSVASSCKEFLKSLPYDLESVEGQNIYLSVLLTLLNSITLRNKHKKRVEHLTKTGRLKDSHIVDFYELEKEEPPVLYHLDESMRDYITVLVRQVRNVIASELTDTLHTKVYEDSLMVSTVTEDFMERYNEN